MSVPPTASGASPGVAAWIRLASLAINGLLRAEYAEYADDAAAEAGGIPLNGRYRTGSVVKVRVT